MKRDPILALLLVCGCFAVVLAALVAVGWVR